MQLHTSGPQIRSPGTGCCSSCEWRASWNQTGDGKFLARLVEGEGDSCPCELFPEVPVFDLTEVGGLDDHCGITCMWIYKNDTDECIRRAGIETQM